MTKNSITTSLQTLFGVTKHELAFAALLVSGILIYAGIRFFGYESGNNTSENLAEEIYRALDSLAEVNTTTYTGINEEGEAIEEIAARDTIVEKENYFPQSKKKETPSTLIDINKASRTELMKLPGIGEKTAENIISYRKNNSFLKPSDIMNIKGIGKKKFEKMKPFIVVK